MGDHDKRKFEGEGNDGFAKKQVTDAEWALTLAKNAMIPYLPVTEEHDIPANKVGIVIGAKGVIIQEIMRRSQCKIIINQDFPEGHPRKILYNGTPASIASAKELIASVIAGGALALQTGGVISGQNPRPSDTISTVEMECPHSKVGLVIGSKGMIIQDLIRRSGCKIVIQQDMPEGMPRKIIFTGTAEQISEAQSLINAIINKSGTSGSNGDSSDATKTYTKELECPQDKVGVVIGSKGVIIQEMMRRTNCKMVVNQDFPDGCPRRVILTGTESQISAATQLLQAVITQGPAALHVTGPGLVTQDINIVQAQVGKVIGPGGTMIKDIQQRCGVKMVIEQEYADTEDRKIRVTGEAERVQAAVQLVCQLLDPLGAAAHAANNVIAMPVPLPAAAAAASYYSGGTVAGTLALGADGTAGQLLPASLTANGTHSQIVLLKKSIAGKVIGKNASTLNLIKSKSGAALTVEHSPEAKNPLLQSSGDEMCRININGFQQCVTLAAQMVQEVLVNGTAKLQAMPDHVAPVLQQQQQQQQQQQMYMAQMAQMQMQQQAAYAQQMAYQQYYSQYAQQYGAYGVGATAAPATSHAPDTAVPTSSVGMSAVTPGQASTPVAAVTDTSGGGVLTADQVYQQQLQKYYAQYAQYAAQMAANGVTVPAATQPSDGGPSSLPPAGNGVHASVADKETEAEAATHSL